LRDHLLSRSNFCRSLEAIVDEISEISDRSTVLISSNFRTDSLNRIRIRCKDETNLIVLSILSWYIPPEIGVLVRFSIEELVRNNSDLLKVRLLLSSKAETILYLLETSIWHTRDFFGNVWTRKEILRALRSVSTTHKTRKRPKREVRKRGYKDHGTLRENHEIHNLWLSTDEQLRIDKDRQSNEDTIDLLKGFFT